MPSSFEELHRLHEQEARQPAFNPDLAGSGREQVSQVKRFSNTVPVVAASPTASPFRGEVHTRAAELRQQAEAAGAGFASKAEIVPTPDGTLASKKSLLKQTGKQVRDDAGASIDVAKDAVKDLIKKKP